MLSIKNKIKKINYRHYIACLITASFLLLTFLLFSNSFTRFIESMRDFGRSIALYIQEIFSFDWHIVPSVTAKSKVPMSPIFNLPTTWEEFCVRWNTYWNVFITKENLTNYLHLVGDILYYLSKYFLLFAVPIILIFVLTVKRYLSKQTNADNKDSKPLKIHKKLSKKIYKPIILWINDFILFIKENKVYKKLWLFIWLWNFNVLFILFEFLAYYFYFVCTFDTSSIYFQFYKLFCDLSKPLNFIPTIAWVFITYWILCVIRKKIGYSRLNHNERKNCGFINERPIVLMVCGTMGKRKTTIITDMALSQDVMFRDKAFKKILENDLKFPKFPWVNLEREIKKAMDSHEIYNLASIEIFISKFKRWFDFGLEYPEYSKCLRRQLNKRGYKYKNLCFDYDYKQYGLSYNDKLKITNLWEVLVTYAKLYFIYVIETSLIISNYSIRVDTILDDVGNFPLWNSDFFEKDSRLIDSFSRHSHIVDFDALRLGKKLIENNPQKDSFEFGVINLTEVGKERKNNLELKECKKVEDMANQKNDGFNDWLKMVRHSATVDMFPFVKVITDEQRPESWGADARDLCEIVHIKSADKFNLLMPFFTITEILYSFTFSKFERLYYQYRYIRSDNTLFMHLVKSVMARFDKYYKGIYNTFGCCTCCLQVEPGVQNGELCDKKYYLMSKKIYSKRFSTDCFSDFFTQKALKGNIGIADLQEFKSEKATFKELGSENSYFMNDLMNKK